MKKHVRTIQDVSDGWRADYWKQTKSKRNWRFAFFQLSFLVLLAIGIVLGRTYDVDEDAFCKTKISLNFPEYSINHARFDGRETCIATVNVASEERRDGLILESNETKELRFRIPYRVVAEGPFGPTLINSRDLAYLRSDDGLNVLATLIGFIGFMGTLMVGMGWMGVDF